MQKNLGSLFKENGTRKSPILLFSLVIFFWTVFDSVIQYTVPPLIEDRGFSKSMVGIIISTASIAGVLFNFIACKVFKDVGFKRMFFLMFLICFSFPLLLWQAKTIWIFILAMSLWGIYFDLYNFGIFDFVGRHTKKFYHSSSFGIIQVFKTMGSMLGPFLVGFLVINHVDKRFFYLSWSFLIVSFILFIVLIYLIRKSKLVNKNLTCPRRSIFFEINLWRKLGKKLSPVLILTFYLFFIESFFWTLAPFYAKESNLGQFGGLFLVAYMLPVLIVGWLVNFLTKRFGKKRVALIGLFFGSLIFSFFSYFPDSFLVLVFVFLASIFLSISLPAISAAFADYISEASQLEREIEGVEGAAFNLGYLFGPIAAGILADFIGIKNAFSIMGMIGIVLAIILLLVMPKSIIIKSRILKS